jgi:NADH:ubiquinone oxidoreductase subunit F (NADH-binding)/NADH:ubiquinone oxidoreductase subunit E
VSDEIPAILAVFPRERQWLLPALQAVQDAVGYLSDDGLTSVGRHLRVPESEVYGVATHYPEFRLQPRGAHHIRVCTGVSCRLLGGHELLDLVARRYGARSSEARADVTLEAADCFFECSVAPMLDVDGTYHGRVTPADIAGIERWFASPAHARPAGPAREAAASPLDTAGTAEACLDRLVEAAARRRSAVTRLRLLVQMGTCGRAVGTGLVLDALRAAVTSSGVPADVIAGACNGMCYGAPAVTIERGDWPIAVVERLGVEQIPALLGELGGADGDFARVGLRGVVWAAGPWRGLGPAGEHPFWKAQERVLLARAGVIDPDDLDDALRAGAYRALARALDGSPRDVIERLKASGLQGRGGAFFPTALKWEACRQASATSKYVVMNGEEGEPGIFKDRHLMEGDPHQVLEGVLLGAYATGATRAILYVHGEAHLSAERLARAVAEATAAGIAGDRMLGRDVACQVELRRGAGGFVLGEETALLESIEGRRALPRTRPPFPVESGLWGMPTVINNVETLAAVPAIVSRGGAWFAALGTERAPGTKVFGLSGPLRRPGVVEVRSGLTLAELLDGIAGGAHDGRPLQGALVGGPSGAIVPVGLFDVPMEPRGRVSPGTGGVVAIPAAASLVEIVRVLLAFNANESCGKCTPCREGTPRLLALLDELAGAADPDATASRIRELATAIQLASLCGLGQAAPLALVRGLETFGPSLVTRRGPSEPT